MSDLDVYTRSTIYALRSGEVVWAGHRDDSFYSDIPGIFDLLNPRILDNNGSLADGLGQDGNGVDGFKGFNVLSIVMQIPVSQLEKLGIPDTVRHRVLREADRRRRLCLREPAAHHRAQERR